MCVPVHSDWPSCEASYSILQYLRVGTKVAWKHPCLLIATPVSCSQECCRKRQIHTGKTLKSPSPTLGGRRIQCGFVSNSSLLQIQQTHSKVRLCRQALRFTLVFTYHAFLYHVLQAFWLISALLLFLCFIAWAFSKV